MLRSASGALDVRGAPAAAALVEQHDAVLRRVEQPTLGRARAAARAAVQEHDGLAVGVARGLPVHLLAVADVEHAGVVRFDLGVEVAHQATIGEDARGARRVGPWRTHSRQ